MYTEDRENLLKAAVARLEVAEKSRRQGMPPNMKREYDNLLSELEKYKKLR